MAQNAQFHKKPYDSGTLCKLEIYRQYLRSWYPVFVQNKTLTSVVVLDYFCGPGSDSEGNHGSPIIALEEAESSLITAYQHTPTTAPIWLYFNDFDSEIIDQLREAVATRTVRPEIVIDAQTEEFLKRLDATEHLLTSQKHACLAFIDQFGVQHVTADVFTRFVQYPKTDLLFFLSSSCVKRFASEVSFQNRIPVSREAIQNVAQTDIHRFLCKEFYKPLVPAGMEYYLAPFSIKKGHNVYGLIFGSRNLLGLQKFLDVCWKLDEIAGESNFNIDGEWVSHDGEFGFEAYAPTAKQEKFQTDLWREIEKSGSTNLSLSRFILESGFLPKHATDFLKRRQQDGQLHVIDPFSGKPKRKGSFYLDWKTYGDEPTKAKFLTKDQADALQQN